MKKDTVTGTQMPLVESAAPVANIADARKARDEKAAEEVCELAPLEAYGAEAVELQDEDHVVKVCDGEQTYVFIVSRPKGRKTFKITEVYPAATKPDTRLREIKEPIDLELSGRFKTFKECIEQIDGIVFEDFEEIPEENEN